MAAIAVLMSAHSHGGGDEGGFPLPFQYGAPAGTSTHSRWYTEMTESTPWQVLLLLLVAIDAALIGEGLLEFTEIVKAFRNLSLLCLIILTTGVICGRTRNEESSPTSFIVFMTSALIVLATFPLLFPDRLLTCQLISISLAAPYIALCSKQAEAMHILISLSVVLPSILLSSIAVCQKFCQNNRSIFLTLPAAVFIAYKLTALICSRIIPTKIAIKTLLFFSGATLLVGAFIAAYYAVLDLPISFGGLFLAVVGGVALNACLVAQRWENSDGDVIDQLQAFFGRSVMSLGMRSFALVGTILMMFAALFPLNTSLTHNRISVFFPVIFLICLYFLFIRLEDPMRTYLHETKRKTILNGVYFFFIIASLLAAAVSISIATSSVTIYKNGVAIPLVPSAEQIAWKVSKETYSFAMLQSSLMFTYFMMTALIKTDKQAKLAAEDAFVRVLSRAAITTTTTVSELPAEPEVKSTSSDEESDAPESVEVIHATLNEPD